MGLLIIQTAQTVYNATPDQPRTALVFGPSALELPAIEKITAQFKVSLVTNSPQFVADLYKKIPNAVVVESDLSGGSFSPLLQPLAEENKYANTLGLFAKCSEAMNTDPITGPPSDLIISYNVACQVVTTAVRQIRAMVTQLPPHDKLPELEKQSTQMEEALFQKGIIKHLNTIHARMTATSVALLADTFHGIHFDASSPPKIRGSIDLWSPASIAHRNSLFSVKEKLKTLWVRNMTHACGDAKSGSGWLVKVYELRKK